MKKFLLYSLLLTVLSITVYKSSAQCTFNYLINPSFETPIQSNNNGNNIITATNPYSGWLITNIVPATPDPWNIVRVNGTGYTGGPDNAEQGSQYADVNSSSGDLE